jgi:hypothetical protein
MKNLLYKGILGILLTIGMVLNSCNKDDTIEYGAIELTNNGYTITLTHVSITDIGSGNEITLDDTELIAGEKRLYPEIRAGKSYRATVTDQYGNKYTCSPFKLKAGQTVKLRYDITVLLVV